VLSWANFGSQLFNGLALGALLALIASGLTIIYGTLGVLNLAHGAMFMLGGYAGFAAYQATQSFVVAVVAGSLALLVFGVVMERVIVRHFYSRPHEDQLLVTFGLAICIIEGVRFFFGSESRSVPSPEAVSGIVSLGFAMYPTYRIVLMGIVCGGSFLILMEALARGGSGYVLTLRNTSVLFAAGLAFFIGERPAHAELAGAALVAGGAVLMAC